MRHVMALFFFVSSHGIAFGQPNSVDCYQKRNMDCTSTTPAPAPAPAACPIKMTIQMVAECAKSPYCAFRNCTSFAAELHNTCNAFGIGCKSVDIRCDGAFNGHRLNSMLVYSEELGRTAWCLVDASSTGGGRVAIGCADQNGNFPQDAVCKAIYQQPGCNCRIVQIHDQPVAPNKNLNPNYCASLPDKDSLDKCNSCCSNLPWIKYIESVGMETDKYIMSCKNRCQEKFRSQPSSGCSSKEGRPIQYNPSGGGCGK